MSNRRGTLEDPTRLSTGGIVLPFRGVWPRIAEDAYVAHGAVVIGDVEIGAQASIWFNCVLRGDDNPIRIGARTNIQDGTVIHVHSRFQGTYIGDDVNVGHMALLHACNLEDRSFVGMGAIVLDEATVESGAMLAGGAMLTPGKRVPSGELWGGRPARKLRDLTEADKASFPVVRDVYVGLGREYIEAVEALARAPEAAK